MNLNKTEIKKENKINLEKLLSSLHRDHQQSLQLCWAIREGIRQNIDPKRIKNYADWYYINELAPHFQIETESLFPLLGMQNALVKKALTQHRRLKKHFTKKIEIAKSLSRIEEDLEASIRFEEKILFNAIRKNATSNQILFKEDIFSHDCNHEQWNDIFWEQESL